MELAISVVEPTTHSVVLADVCSHVHESGINLPSLYNPSLGRENPIKEFIGVFCKFLLRHS